MRRELTSILVGLVITSSACGTRVPPPNRIVIGSTRDVYAIDEKGVKISVSPPFSFYDVSAPSSSVQWSPNHEWVVYQTEETASPDDPKIFIVKADGTKKFERTDNDQHSGNYQRSGENPAWSPEGNQIAAYFWNGFWDSRKAGIYIVDVSCFTKGQDCNFEYRYLEPIRKMPWRTKYERKQT